MLIVLLDIPDDEGSWGSRAWNKGKLQTLQQKIMKRLPSLEETDFHQTSLSTLSVPRTTSVVFLRIVSPSEVRDTTLWSNVQALVKYARAARLHAALAEDPRGNLDRANESPVFLLRSLNKADDGQLFTFSSDVGRVAKPSDGRPSWFGIAEQDVLPGSQTIEYAEAVVQWFSECPAQNVKQLYVNRAITNQDLWPMLNVLFELLKKPPEPRKTAKSILGVRFNKGPSSSGPSLYYFTPRHTNEALELLRATPTDPPAEALVYSNFRLFLTEGFPWKIVASHELMEMGSEVHLAYLQQTGGLSPEAKTQFKLRTERD